jgi:hypothetical protein
LFSLRFELVAGTRRRFDMLTTFLMCTVRLLQY